MRIRPAARLLSRQSLDHFLERTISRLRWATIAALLTISLVAPSGGEESVPDWVLVVGFAGYNLLASLIHRRYPGTSAFAWLAALDLPVIALVYLQSGVPGGPLFILLILAAVQTTVFMTLVGSLIYTAALAAVSMSVEPAFPMWTGSIEEIRASAGRLLILALVGIGIGMLTRRLEAERAAGQTMSDQAVRLQDLDQIRTDFIATVSHDLRTPLTAARAGLGLLETSAGNVLHEDQRNLLTNVRRNIERLALLIDDLLTYNQMEAGTLRIEREMLDLRAVVIGALAAIYPLTDAKGQTLELNLPEQLPCQGDPRRLEQAILNVLANGHRHTPCGTRIVVTGGVTGDAVTLSIADDGPGIPTSELEPIFRRFHRLGDEPGGSGLGLAIARHVIELHGGTVRAESAVGNGATFVISLPQTERIAPGEVR